MIPSIFNEMVILEEIGATPKGEPLYKVNFRTPSVQFMDRIDSEGRRAELAEFLFKNGDNLEARLEHMKEMTSGRGIAKH